MRNIISKTLILFVYAICFTSCKQENACKKITYQINESDQKNILKTLESHDFKKLIIITDIDSKSETIDLCFQEIHHDSHKLKELYIKTNRFLKLSDEVFIPVITSEDILLTRSKNVLNTTGCNFKFTTTLP